MIIVRITKYICRKRKDLYLNDQIVTLISIKPELAIRGGDSDLDVDVMAFYPRITALPQERRPWDETLGFFPAVNGSLAQLISIILRPLTVLVLPGRVFILELSWSSCRKHSTRYRFQKENYCG